MLEEVVVLAALEGVHDVVYALPVVRACGTGMWLVDEERVGREER